MAASVAHFDVHGADSDEAELHGFYGGLLGWEIDVKGPGYALVRTPEGSPDGAIVGSGGRGFVMGVTVEDLDAAVARVVELGGSVEMPPTDNGWVVKASVRDPAGNLLTLIQA